MKFIKTDVFASRVGVTDRCVRKWITLGRLPGCRRNIHGYYLVPENYTSKVLAGELPLKSRHRKEENAIITL